MVTPGVYITDTSDVFAAAEDFKARLIAQIPAKVWIITACQVIVTSLLITHTDTYIFKIHVFSVSGSYRSDIEVQRFFEQTFEENTISAKRAIAHFVP